MGKKSHFISTKSAHSPSQHSSVQLGGKAQLTSSPLGLKEKVEGTSNIPAFQRAAQETTSCLARLGAGTQKRAQQLAVAQATYNTTDKSWHSSVWLGECIQLVASHLGKKARVENVSNIPAFQKTVQGTDSCLTRLTALIELAYLRGLGSTKNKRKLSPCCSTRDPVVPQTDTRGSNSLQAPEREISKPL